MLLILGSATICQNGGSLRVDGGRRLSRVVPARLPDGPAENDLGQQGRSLVESGRDRSNDCRTRK